MIKFLVIGNMGISKQSYFIINLINNNCGYDDHTEIKRTITTNENVQIKKSKLKNTTIIEQKLYGKNYQKQQKQKQQQLSHYNYRNKNKRKK